MTVDLSAKRTRVTKTFCTTREAAQILGVALRTVQMWTNNGLIDAWKTQGGHRRISRESVERLVARPPASTAAAPAEAAPANRQKTPAAHALHILVVEDDPLLQHLYRINLARWPMRPHVTTASNGYEALVLLGRETPDLLILDLHMPEFDGFRVLRSLREMPELDAVRIIVVSGLDPAEIQARGEIPADIPVLPKPISFTRLQELAESIAVKKTASRTQTTT